MVDLGGYVIVLVEKDGKIKLFGSAAERNDCDEILEINGSSLDQMSHEQIIHHIHQCIKTRTICLRVKRRSSGKLGSSIDSSLIDAFVIGSRAREHLQTLTKDANITPKDIAQLSKILSENANETNESIKQQSISSTNKENEMKLDKTINETEDRLNLKKSDSGDIIELTDENMQLLNINPGANISLKKTDSQQSIVDLVKRSASISLSNTSLNNIVYSKKLDDEEAKKYIPFKRLNSVIRRLEENLDDGNLKRLIEKTNFKTLIDIYSTLMQERYINTSFIDLDSVQLHQEVIELLQNKGNVDDDFIELLEILNKFEYDGLFQVLNNALKSRKRLSIQDDISIQEEENREEENESTQDDVFEANDEDVAVREDDQIDKNNVSLKKEEQNENEQEIKKENQEEENDDEIDLDRQQKDNNEFSQKEEIDEQIKEDNLIEQPPIVPPLPCIQIINSLNLESQQQQPQNLNLITTTAEIPSLASLASVIHSITSTQPINSSPNQIPSDQINLFQSNINNQEQQQQNVLQNTFLSTVNDSLNYVNSSDLTQTPYCNLQSTIQPISNLVYNNLSTSPLRCTLSNLDNQAIQSNLCNLEYSNQSSLNAQTDIPIINNLPILGTFDLNNVNNIVQFNELTQQQISNQNLQHQQQQLNQTISALDYAKGAIPPAPPAPQLQKQAIIHTSLPPNLNNLPPNLPENTKLSIVKIEKHSSEPLGATVRNEIDGRVTIGRIVCGGAASKCSAALQEGDEILMVNNIYIRGKTVDQVCELLSQMQGTLTFVISKSELNKKDRNEQIKLNVNNNVERKSSTSSQDSNGFANYKVTHYKAFFDYDPTQDLYIPCRELGLLFRKGDLLHIIDLSDNFWWQAYKEGDLNQNLAGLIPSLKFQMMREEAAKKMIEQQNEKKQEEQIELDSLDSSINRRTASSILSLNCGKTRSRSTSKKRKSRKEELPSLDNYVPYEEMKQSMGLKRTVVLVGPTNIGRQSLRERLVKFKNLYGTAIPHTSRNKRSDEKNGEDYYFVSKPQFEQFIEDNKFVEFGDYDKSYYGTSYSSIEDVLKSNKTCILNLHVQSILKLRAEGKKFKPFFVFIAPPTNLDVLRKLVESINNMPISLNELHAIINEAYEIKQHFAHYFDLILTVTDLEETYRLLLNEINSLDKEPQWIPTHFLE